MFVLAVAFRFTGGVVSQRQIYLNISLRPGSARKYCLWEHKHTKNKITLKYAHLIWQTQTAEAPH